MNDAAPNADTQQILVDEVFPAFAGDDLEDVDHGRTDRPLDDGAGWIRTGQGQTIHVPNETGGAWDGVIRCEVLEVVPNERLAYAWKGGDEGNVGYGSRLDTVVTWTLTKVDSGTRLRLVHSGFVTPKNDSAFKSMSGGWLTVIQNFGAVASEQH